MADKKAAKKLSVEMHRRQLKKDLLAREEALDIETSKRLKEKWFEILLRSKLPEMKENLRSILDYMEKLVEMEVYRKRLFEEERIELSDQQTIQAQSHSQALDNLYNLYLQRVHDLNEIYTEQVKKKKEEAEEEFEKIIEQDKKSEDCMNAILFQMDVNQKKKVDLMKCEMFLNMDDEKSKNAEKDENLRMRMERLMEKRWSQISTTLAVYQQNTESRRKHYWQLKARDKQDSKMIYSQMKKTQKLSDQIQHLKNLLENPCPTNPEMILMADYREERTKFYNSFVYLKKVMAEEMKQDDLNLKNLTRLSKGVNDYLDHFIKKGEKILTLFTLCLKLETEKEKVVPVGSSLYKTKIPPQFSKQLNLTPLVPLASNVNQEVIKAAMLDDFQQFWQKYAKVRLTMVALSQCIRDMENENEELKKLLNSYFIQM